ncbi:hypothetical protein [Streptomyces sp. NPDC013489]|uniref:hypothetical protein n=1 Tax=Streptomyces sp. NPDC013489 TaxID=3155606 RepID=UPI0033E40CEE
MPTTSIPKGVCSWWTDLPVLVMVTRPAALRAAAKPPSSLRAPPGLGRGRKAAARRVGQHHRAVRQVLHQRASPPVEGRQQHQARRVSVPAVRTLVRSFFARHLPVPACGARSGAASVAVRRAGRGSGSAPTARLGRPPQ